MVSVSDFSSFRKKERTHPSKMRDFSKLRTEEAEGSDLLECLLLFLERGIWRGEKKGVLIKDRPLFLLLLIFFVPLSHTIRSSSKSKWTIAQRVHTDLKTASHAQSLKISDIAHYKLIFKQSESERKGRGC